MLLKPRLASVSSVSYCDGSGSTHKFRKTWTKQGQKTGGKKIWRQSNRPIRASSRLSLEFFLCWRTAMTSSEPDFLLLNSHCSFPSPLLGCECMQCAPGWLEFGTSCFFLSTNRLSWDESRMNCTARGGSLAVISNQKVQVDVTILPPLTRSMIQTMHEMNKNTDVLSSRGFCLRCLNWPPGLGWD